MKLELLFTKDETDAILESVKDDAIINVHQEINGSICISFDPITLDVKSFASLLEQAEYGIAIDTMTVESLVVIDGGVGLVMSRKI